MLSVLGLSAVLSLALAACGSSGSTSTPAASKPASAPASVAAICAESNVEGSVKVSIENFAFAPSAITAKVGDTITFTNGDTASHTATLDDDTCATGLITNTKSDGLTFTAAGTYPFHCSIHTDMKGTITVS
jgi:plastocyanin